MSFLRLPPFPGHRAGPLVVAGDARGDVDELIAVLRQERVGGAFWLPPETGLNPWHGGGRPRDAALVQAVLRGERDVVAAGITGQGRDPFTGEAISLVAVARLLGRWRRGIEANRGMGGVLGVARWKRVTMAPMLWDGGGAVPFGRRQGRIVGWRARMAGVPDVEVEDGFIRSVGLGAACVPPLSVVVDTAPHIDPARENGLEAILMHAVMDEDVLARAAALRGRLVAGGIGKYGAGRAQERRDGRRTVLVCGQVEDDRAMLLGGAGVTNLMLLQRARAMEPDARILWRPHPDVEAGLRKGALDARGLADGVAREGGLASLLGQVDAVHVVCSLAGFEALLRGVPVVTHGVPFYAGWGLTRDLGPVPARRARRLALDELVAGALLLYPRYVDPVTLLPCEAEVVVGRIEEGRAAVRSGWFWLVWVRRVLGFLRGKGKAGGVTPPAPRTFGEGLRGGGRGAGSAAPQA